MTIDFKLAVAAPAVAPSAMSVRSAGLGSLKPAAALNLTVKRAVNLKGSNLSLAYAGTDARVISADSAVLGRESGLGLASNVEPGGWHRSERTSVITRDERPTFFPVTACEQQQVEDMTQVTQVMGSTGIAGMHGYPSWRTRT